jgi:hypothetical protein
MNLPQVRLEPLLKARAEELCPGRIRFGHELTDLEHDEHGVQALIRDNASGREYVGRAAYLIGADGGRLVHRLIGVEYEVLGMITQTATLYVSADFSRCAPDPDVLIRWIGDVPVRIRKITRWLVDAVLASSFCRGGAFLGTATPTNLLPLSPTTVPRRSRPTTSASTSRRRVRAPLFRTARVVGISVEMADPQRLEREVRFVGDLPRCRAPGVTVFAGDEQEAPWSDEVLDRDAISVLTIEPGARCSAIARSETRCWR